MKEKIVIALLIIMSIVSYCETTFNDRYYSVATIINNAYIDLGYEIDEYENENYYNTKLEQIKKGGE